MESSLSLEETNKIRVSLGLKPLVDDGAPVDVKEKAAEDNYAERKEQEQAGQRRRFAYSIRKQDAEYKTDDLCVFLAFRHSQLKARLDK